MSEMPPHILLVEDNAFDIKAFRRAFREAGHGYPISVARDGLYALEMLRAADGFGEFGAPQVVVLDLNMPRMKGGDLLKEIRSDPALSSITVFVLTTSDARADMNEVIKLGITGYLLKSAADETLVGPIVAFLESQKRTQP